MLRLINNKAQILVLKNEQKIIMEILNWWST